MMIEQLYQTPEGFIDVPFVYVFDGRELTDGTDPENLAVALQDNDFFLRSVAGMDTVAGTWLYEDASQREAMSALIATTPRYTVVPEKVYPGQGQIRFRLGTVAKAANVSGNFVSFIGFQGVRRAPKDNAPYLLHETPYDYWEKDYAYRLSMDLDFYADGGSGSRQFEVDVQNYDFELNAVYVRRTDTDAALGADTFLVVMYDASGYYKLSNRAFPVRWLNYSQGSNYFSVFPVPPIVYPNTGVIRFDVETLLDQADGPHTYEFVFKGKSRIPC